MDVLTILLYTALSVLNIFMFKLSVGYKEHHNKKYASIINGIIILYMTVFAAGRYVSEDSLIGGADAYAYIMRFENANEYFSKFEFFGFLRLSNEEPFYTLLTVVIRILTDNYHIYFGVIYGIIISCFVYFVYNMYDKESNLLSLLLLTPYYIYSFNIMRTMLAAALCAVAVVKVKKNKWGKALLFSILAFFSHYSALIFILVIVGAFLYRRSQFKVNKYKLLIGAICCNIVSFAMFSVIKNILLSTRYSSYFLADLDYSVLGWIPTIFLCVVTILFTRDFLEYNNVNYLILIAITMDFALMYIMVARAGWRMNDYFHLIRMFVLSEFCTVTEKRFEHGTSRMMAKIAVNVFIVILFVQFLFSLRADCVYPYVFLNFRK